MTTSPFTLIALLDYAYLKDAIVASDVPADYVDDTGFDYTRLVPEDRVAPYCPATEAHFDAEDRVWRCDADDLPVWQHFQG